MAALVALTVGGAVAAWHGVKKAITRKALRKRGLNGAAGRVLASLKQMPKESIQKPEIAQASV